MGEWIEWNGGDQPVADEVMVDVRFRDGLTFEPVVAMLRDWSHWPVTTVERDGPHSDIVAYRIVTP